MIQLTDLDDCTFYLNPRHIISATDVLRDGKPHVCIFVGVPSGDPYFRVKGDAATIATQIHAATNDTEKAELRAEILRLSLRCENLELEAQSCDDPTYHRRAVHERHGKPRYRSNCWTRTELIPSPEPSAHPTRQTHGWFHGLD